MALVQGSRVGAYQVTAQIGAGGMGEVYRARDTRLDRDVALKVLPRDVSGNPERRARLLREARAAAALNHPNICTIHDVGEADGEIYIAMEAIDGEPLSTRLAMGELLPEEILKEGVQLADALAHAHDRGVVHRDLKSANIMVTPEGRVKVLDFGLAKRVIDELDNERAEVATRPSTSATRAGMVLGTLPYMAPEQLRGQPADARSDLWSLGVVLYEMAAGGRPFRGQTEWEISSAILHDPPPPLPPRIGEPLSTVIGRCLEKEPARRYQRAGEVRAALETASGSSPRFATSGVNARWRRRIALPTRRVVAAAVTVGILVVALTAAITRRWIDVPFATSRVSSPASGTVTPRTSVAVLGFRNLSSSPDVAWMSNALSEILAAEIAAGEQLRIVSGENVVRMKTDLALSDAESYGADTLQRVRANLGSDAVLLGSFLAVGAPDARQIRLNVRIQDARSGETTALVTDTSSDAELLEMMSRVAAQVRARLGVPAPSPGESQAARAAVPATAEATRLYIEGLTRLRRFETLQARELLEKAIAVDSRHPLAHAALAAAWGALGYVANAQQEARRAVDLSGALSRAERLWVQARYHETMREWPAAVDIYDTLLGLFPDNVDYGLQLAAAQTAAGRGRDALATLDRLRTLPPPSRDDPRIDLAEAVASSALTDFKRSLVAASRAESKAAAQGSRLLAARARFEKGWALSNLGQHKDAIAATDEARRLFGEGGDRSATARAQVNMAIMHSRQGEYARAQQLYEEALATNRDIGNDGGVAFALNNLANLFADRRRYAEARRTYEEALAIQRKIGNKASEAGVLGNLANILQYEGNLAASRRMHEASLELYRQVGAKLNVAIELTNLGELLLDQGDLASARRLLDEAIVLKREVGSRSSIAFTLTTLADVLLAQGDVAAARRTAEESLKLRQELGEKIRAAENRLQLAQITLEEGNGQGAAAEAQAVAAVLADDDAETLTEALIVQTRAALAQGNANGAAATAERLRALLPAIETLELRNRALLARVEADVAAGRIAPALTRAQSIITAARESGLGLVELEARYLAARIELARGQPDRAAAQLQALEKEAASRGAGLIVRKVRSELRTKNQDPLP